MASIFKQFGPNDIVSTRSLLHEQIPITGSIISGSTYNGDNIRNEPNGYLQSVYDFPIASASANPLVDITFGYSSNSSLSSSTSAENAKKIQIYNQMAQVLVGHDASGSILQFDEDGDIASGGTKLTECFFLAFSRLLSKDEIKKGSFTIKLGQTDAYASANNVALTIQDTNAQNDFRTNSPAGEYAILTSSVDGPFGLLYYQAGVAVITASAFTASSNVWDSSGNSLLEAMTGSAITGVVEGFRHRVAQTLEFNNTTELNSAVHFIKIDNNEFNYSANPTYTSGSKMVVKNNATEQPVSYPTTIGLYSPDGELMATAKLSEPLKKTPENAYNLRVRLDY